jgi:very-short-patch-repair endonuclease
MLRAYLDYAERGVVALASEVTEDGAREPDSPFEMAVEEALRSQGLDVRRQVGCGGFRIDLALVHPSQKGQYVLGIECDGATYHSLATARERDRLRQEILEGLGWTICRVWSTDWIRNPESQIKRIMQAFEKALKAGPCETAKERRLPQARQERPILRVRNEDGDDTGPAYSFGSINEVPAAVLNSVILGVLRRYGQTTDAELIKATARELRRADGDRLCGS